MEAVHYRKKKQENIQLLLLYQRLVDLQESCWTKLFRFQKSEYFTQFQKKYSIPRIINIRLDDFIYLLLLGILQIIFGVLPMSSSNVFTTPYRQSLALFFLTSFLAITSPHWFKWLALFLFCIIYPGMLYSSLNGYINLMPADTSTPISNYIGYMTLVPIFFLLILIYPMKQFIRNSVGSIYSYIYGLSITLILYLWPLYSFITELSDSGSVGFTFITNNTALVTAFIVIIVTGIYFFIHNSLFQPKLEKVQELLLQDFTQGQLTKAIQQIQQMQVKKKSVIYQNFNVFARSMSFIIYSITLALQIFLYFVMVNNSSEMTTLGIIMGYIMVFQLFGAVFIYIKLTPIIALPIVAILSLASAFPSLSYYKSSTNFYTYIFISLSAPFLVFFWSLINNISKKAIIFRINTIIVLFITIFLPVIALVINNYNYFTSNPSVVSIVNYILLGMIGVTIILLLILFIVWEVSKYKIQNKNQQKSKVAVDYNYFQQGNPQYKYYQIDQQYSVNHLANIDLRQISYITGMCFFICSELLTIHAVNLLNTQFSTTVFYSTSINQIIYSSFVTILVFYLYSHCYLANPQGDYVRNIFFVIFISLSAGGLIAGQLSTVGTTTLKIIGGFSIFMIALLIALQAIKTAAEKIFGFVSTIIVIAMWIFIILPYVQIIPFVSLFVDQTNFGIYIFGCIIGSVILLIFLVGLLTLIFNQLIDKYQQQKKFKFVMEDVVTLFSEEGIEAGDEQLHILYQSFMYRDKKYVFFLKRGYPVNLLQDPDDKITKLVTSEDYALKRIPTKRQFNNQTNKKQSLLWSCLTFCCGEDDEEIQQKIKKAKRTIDKEQLQLLLPRKLIAGLFKKQKQAIMHKNKKKWKNPTKVHSSKSLILKDLHVGPRYLGDQYILLKTSKNADLAIQIWHNIFDFTANTDEGEPLIISNDFHSLLQIAKVDVPMDEVDKIIFQLSTKKWGQYNGMDLQKFSLAVQIIAEKMYKQKGQEAKYSLLIEVVFYNLSIYEQFNDFMIEKKTTRRVTKNQIKKSPFQNSFQRYKQFLNQKNKQQSQMIQKHKKLDVDKQVSLQAQQSKQIQIQKQVEVSNGPSCKKIIFDKVKSCEKCCKKQETHDDFQRKLFVRPWNLVSVDSVKIMEKKQNDWGSVTETKQHPFRPTSNNILVAVLKILDLYTYLSYSITNPRIGWISDQSNSNLILDYQIQTYIAIGIVAVSVPLGIKGIILIFQDRLGLTQNRLPAVFPHPMFFFTFIYKLMILSLFNTVLQTFLDTFNCNWTATTYIYVLSDNTSIQCFSDYHTKIALVALLCIILYYPLSSYAMPNAQFAEKSLDLKYRPSYLILYFQVNFVLLASKVLLSGANTYTSIQIIYNAINIFSLSVLGLSIFFTQPCFVTWFNWVQLAIICIGLVVHVCGFVLYLTGLWTFCVIFASSVCAAIIIITIIAIKGRFFSRQVNDQKEANVDNVKQLQMMWNYKQKNAKFLIGFQDRKKNKVINNLVQHQESSDQQHTQQLLK